MLNIPPSELNGLLRSRGSQGVGEVDYLPTWGSEGKERKTERREAGLE